MQQRNVPRYGVAMSTRIDWRTISAADAELIRRLRDHHNLTRDVDVLRLALPAACREAGIDISDVRESGADASGDHEVAEAG